MIRQGVFNIILLFEARGVIISVAAPVSLLGKANPGITSVAVSSA